MCGRSWLDPLSLTPTINLRRVEMLSDSIKANLAIIGVFLFVAVLIVGAVWWTKYKFDDCRMVGHSWVYCVGKLGS